MSSIASAAVCSLNRRHGEDRLALVARLVGERGLVRRFDLIGQVVGGQNAHDAGKRLGRHSCRSTAPGRAAWG